MTNHRIARISEEMKRELAQMIRDEIKDPRVKGLISITRVDVTNDLRYAKVYVSILSQEDQHANTLLGLEKASGYLRSELAQRIQLRYTPELIFKLDDSIAYGTKINEIIQGFKKEERKGESDV
ncbi:MAG: ribosome-binding factor A [Firmicutes bacterium HGW-Firmicutes-12]|jgi:ribosome-binding factor A|nr:MAG: ribosome-binding factor A [Firmicutes bacterium HGW-Firmicutes-12]